MRDADGNVITVHPLAAWPPMLSDDEMTALAEDIRENGLLLPIVVDEDGTLIDGRNRKRACEMAEVEPRYEKLNGHDPEALIVSSNLRRDMSKGQKAMFLARAFPDTKRGKRSEGSATTLSETNKVSTARLSQARSVLRHSMALAEDVMAGRIALDAALAQIQREREASVSTDARMAELRAGAPEIAALVDDERLTLEAGLTELRQRQQKIRQLVDGAKTAIAKLADIPMQVAVAMQGLPVADEDMLADFDFPAVTAAIKRLAQLKTRASNG